MAGQSSRALKQRLIDGFASLRTINDHSHVISESERLERDLDALAYFAHPYPAADLQSAGMSADDIAFVTTPASPEAPGGASLEERWARFAPYWRHVQLTGFSQCLLEGWRAVFGIDELTAATVGPLSDAIRAARRPGHYHDVLRDQANISISLVQMEDLVEVDRTLFLPMPRLNRFTMLRERANVAAIERDYSVRLRSLDDLVAAMHAVALDWRGGRCAGDQALAELSPAHGLPGAHVRRGVSRVQALAGRPLRRPGLSRRPRAGGLPGLCGGARGHGCRVCRCNSTWDRVPVCTAAWREPRLAPMADAHPRQPGCALRHLARRLSLPHRSGSAGEDVCQRLPQHVLDPHLLAGRLSCRRCVSG